MYSSSSDGSQYLSGGDPEVLLLVVSTLVGVVVGMASTLVVASAVGAAMVVSAVS